MRDKGVAIMGGARQFGFPGLDPTWVGPEGERRAVADEQVAREREGLRDAAIYLNDGGELAQVARDWNEAGLLTIKDLSLLR
jgi:hypothetical protein